MENHILHLIFGFRHHSLDLKVWMRYKKTHEQIKLHGKLELYIVFIEK